MKRILFSAVIAMAVISCNSAETAAENQKDSLINEVEQKTDEMQQQVQEAADSTKDRLEEKSDSVKDVIKGADSTHH